MPLARLDEDRLTEALALAELSIGLSDPNPRVGCIIGLSDGTVLGRGHTQQAGGAHAEAMALRDAASRGADLRGATAWVTLEPCAHHGRTPPCADALIAAGIARVVAAGVDPFPAVAGRGFGRLRAADVDVLVAGGAIAREARELNIGFFSRVLRGRPWVRLKAAASLDGRTALPDGRSQWITGEAARRDGHAWRRRAGAVLTGIGTVVADNPRLDVRLIATARQPMRAVIDPSLRLPLDCRLLATPGLMIYSAAGASAGLSATLQARGAEVIPVARSPGGIDLGRVLADLSQREVNEVHVEAGAKLNGAFLQSGLVDELLLYVAPVLLGAGAAIASLKALDELSEAIRLRLHSCSQLGEDLCLRLRPGVDAHVSLGAAP